MIDAYLERIGLSSSPAVDLDGLRALHRAHLAAVPFENLDIHLGRPISIDPERIVDKLVGQRRGGFCYELNGGFAELLRALGFSVGLLEARVSPEEPGLPFDHLCLRVELDEPWLADVGFGASFLQPLRLEPGLDQHDPAGTFRIDARPDGWLRLEADGSLEYRFALTPRALADFTPGSVFHQTSPESHFTKNPVCSRPTATGRVTLRARTLIETTGATRTERTVAHDELGEIYRSRFGIELGEDELALL